MAPGQTTSSEQDSWLVSSIRPAATLSHPSDSSELRWYFRTGGLAVFETSSFGKQLDRAAMMAFGGHDCKRCHGSGFVPSDPDKWRESTKAEREWMALLGLAAAEVARPLADRVCQDCNGSGWTPKRHRTNARTQLTARQKFANGGGSKKGRIGGVEVSDTSVARMGGITARLAFLTLVERALLEDYYSPSGGSLMALYAWTAAGKTLLRRNSQQLTPRQFFENEIAAEASRSEARRKALLATAEEQAAELHRGACAAWISTKRRVDDAKVRTRALQLLDGGDE